MKTRNTGFVLAILLLGFVCAANGADDVLRLETVKKLYEQQKWEEVLRAARGPTDQSADFDYYAGMALSHLERWKEARDVFSAGAQKKPHDARFLTERAGTEYKLNDFRFAKKDLRRAMRLGVTDSYLPEFLGTIYLLEGNIEAALKYWNIADKPRLAAVEATASPKTDKMLLERAVLFSPPGTFELDSFLKSDALLENLGEFPGRRTELAPVPSSNRKDSDEYKATLHLNERNGWGSSFLDGAISLLRGLPYETVFPSDYNLRGEAVNLDSLLRWDAQKRRAAATFSMPFFRQPGKRLRLWFDARNENWNLSRTFSGNPVPISDLKMKRYAGGVEFHVVESGRWDLTLGAEGVSREFVNVPAGVAKSAKPFFADGRSADAWVGAHRSLIRVPERRNYGSGLGAFSSVRGALKSRWLAEARGDDYEFLATLRGGNTYGKVPLDELFQLGVERDNDLWLRGHAGALAGRKGAAPLGRRYVLLNSELNKTAYDGAFFRIQIGPFFDSGAIADSTDLFGSRKWLFDAGVQARVRVMGSVSVILSYGRDLRGGKGVFYGNAIR